MRGLKWMAVGMLLVLVAGAGVAWWQRDALQTWWVLRGLSRATENNRDAWIERVAALGTPAIPALIECLSEGDDQACLNGLAALDHLARAWGVADPATADLAHRLTRPYSRLSPVVQAQLLGYLTGWFSEESPAEGLVPAIARILSESASKDDADVQSAGLDLAVVLVRQPGGLSLPAAREMARAGLRSSSAKVRVKAVRLCLQPGMELLEQVAGLLRDPSVEVRRAVILAVGPAEQLVREDVLLPGLHDTDADVRKHTEAALRSRGLRPEHLELGRLLTHPQPTTRLQVLDRIRALFVAAQGGRDVDLDPGVWLRRLSHDPSLAVRAAALRLMSQQSLIDLTDRIDQMARSDPSPTICQLARFYLARKHAPGPAER
jgi:hypothetical protein